MRNLIFFKGLVFDIKTSLVKSAFIFIIVLLTGACAAGTKKQTLASVNQTDEVSAKGESIDDKLTGDNEIVCRNRITTGSRFKRKICQTKKAWALYDNKNLSRTEQFERDIKSSDVNTMTSDDPSAVDPVGRMPR